VAVRAPLLDGAAPAPQPVGGHHVVHVQPHAGEAIGALAVEPRHEQWQRVHEVRRQVDHQRPLEQRLAHEPEVEVLQVAQPAVHQLRRARRGARRPVLALDKRDAVAARRRVQRHPGAGDSAADDG
jgi:hypothetical protein